MLENWTPVHSGAVGGVAATLLMVWASLQKTRIASGKYVLEFPVIMKIILIFGGFLFPPLAVFAVFNAVEMFSSGTDLLSNLIWAVVAAINVGLAIAGPYTAYRTIFESVHFDESGFVQTRTLPKSRREVLWADIESHGYNRWLQYYWLKPATGPDFWYWDGMHGLSNFRSYLQAGFQSRGVS